MFLALELRPTSSSSSFLQQKLHWSFFYRESQVNEYSVYLQLRRVIL